MRVCHLCTPPLPPNNLSQSVVPCSKTQELTAAITVKTQHSRSAGFLHKPPQALVPVQILSGLGQAPLQVAAACIS
jgi:hypothetical protein